MGDTHMKKLLLMIIAGLLSANYGLCMTEVWKKTYISSSDSDSEDSDTSSSTSGEWVRHPRMKRLLKEEEQYQDPIDYFFERSHTSKQASSFKIKTLLTTIVTTLRKANAEEIHNDIAGIKTQAYMIVPNWIAAYKKSDYSINPARMAFDFVLQKSIALASSLPERSTDALMIAQHLYDVLPEDDRETLKEISQWERITQGHPGVKDAVQQMLCYGSSTETSPTVNSESMGETQSTSNQGLMPTAPQTACSQPNPRNQNLATD